ncbi:unnamed protein product [Ambrosiozyma monospora]|uniref:Unnamed protein product n=1 Tax=Ambrosiozyma monospora TaxID=43982 RepID=A0ACB5U2V2_AMBMO|nr:unnamed protein product [Ambrosiozyma monospora]
MSSRRSRRYQQQKPQHRYEEDYEAVYEEEEEEEEDDDQDEVTRCFGNTDTVSVSWILQMLQRSIGVNSANQKIIT